MPNEIPTHSREAVKVRDFGRCFRCGGRGAQWHHRRSRSVRDIHTHSPGNGLWLCTTCHDWVHANPFEARRFGWIVSRSVSDPASIPAKAHLGWVRLDHSGSFSYASDVEDAEAGG